MQDNAPAARLQILCVGGIRHKLKHLSANLGHATIRNPKAARCAERKVEDAAANPRSTVGDANEY
jgi:hypothetical protein